MSSRRHAIVAVQSLIEAYDNAIGIFEDGAADLPIGGERPTDAICHEI
jgi:hypothetical protein